MSEKKDLKANLFGKKGQEVVNKTTSEEQIGIKKSKNVKGPNNNISKNNAPAKKMMTRTSSRGR